MAKKKKTTESKPRRYLTARFVLGEIAVDNMGEDKVAQYLKPAGVDPGEYDDLAVGGWVIVGGGNFSKVLIVRVE